MKSIEIPSLGNNIPTLKQALPMNKEANTDLLPPISKQLLEKLILPKLSDHLPPASKWNAKQVIKNHIQNSIIMAKDHTKQLW